MTVQELMRLADRYAAALANFYRNCGEYSEAQTARQELEEAMTLTSQFGGL